MRCASQIVEIEELFRDIYNDPLDPPKLAELERRTEGWAASLQLVEVSLRERRTPEERRHFIQSITATKDSDLFDFLAEEVLDQQTDETRNLLLSTSILHQITAEVAERLAGVHDGRRALDDLEQRGLFTNRLDEERFRYHNLFREFLERRLIADRSESEVVGLHIHAASYFETSAQWPEAIHHYLRAGLQRQAARLIAKYGEEVVAEGRLGLVDQWLQQLPEDTIKQNARLSLLYGEACGIRGDWDRALESLERARTFFARKGDRRLEALACLKLSTVYSNLGDPSSALQAAHAGAAMVPDDAFATRLRLEGNVAITETWLSGQMAEVVAECQRIAAEADRRGLEHFAAIARHNAGGILLRMGHADLALPNLDRAADFWADPPTSPFADNAELVATLLALGRLERARAVAADAVNRTDPWPRPKANAMYGLANVMVADGQTAEALEVLRAVHGNSEVLGGLHPLIDALAIETLYLAGRHDEIPEFWRELSRQQIDPRYAVETAAAQALGQHVSSPCVGACQEARSLFDRSADAGARLTAIVGRTKVSLLGLEHGGRDAVVDAVTALEAGRQIGLWRSIRPWLRRFVPYAKLLARRSDGTRLLAGMALADPEGWRPAVVQAVMAARGNDRAILLGVVSRIANRDTLTQLSDVRGEDVAVLRRTLRIAQAPRLFLRTLGGLETHRAAWDGPVIPIEKKRARMLLAVLAGHVGTTLNRDVALDILWPEADPDLAVNSLNQTVFQLRRYIDPDYRGGESAEYIVSTTDKVGLNPELVHTDLAEIARLPERLAAGDWHHRQATASRAIRLVHGEFLADLRYEEWVARQQLSVHGRIRESLLPIATGSSGSFECEVSIQAATAMLALDPFDESAVLALADGLSRSGRRVAAKQLIAAFLTRLQDELDLEPSAQLRTAAAAF